MSQVHEKVQNTMKSSKRIPLMLSLAIASLLLISLWGIAGNWMSRQARAADTNSLMFLPVILKPYNFNRPANPLNLPVRLDPSRSSGGTGLVETNEIQAPLALDDGNSIKAAVPVSGGVITTTATDGSLFTLTIPDGALVTDTQVTLIPVTAIADQPLGGYAGAAVQLQPEGLQFLLPVTLTIEISATIPVESELTVSWHGDGQDFHHYPVLLEYPYPQVAFRLMHFSGFGYLGDNISIPIDDGYTPSDPEDQFKQAWDEVIRREREAQANGQPGDPNFGDVLARLLREYYRSVIKPMLNAAEGDCDYAESGVISKANTWAHEAEVLGFHETLGDELQDYNESYIRVLENCWRERTQPCLNRHDLDAWRKALYIARMGQMAGLDFNIYEVPECVCDTYANIEAWNLTFEVSFRRSAQGLLDGGPDYLDVSVNHNQSGSILLDHKTGWPPYPGWDSWSHGGGNMPSGTATINDTATVYSPDGDEYTDTTEGSGIVAGDATLWIDEDTCTYILDLSISTHVVDDSFQKPPEEGDMSVLGLYLRDRNAYYVDPEQISLSGSAMIDAGVGGPYIEHIDLSHGYASHHLFNLFGDDVGYGYASWTLTPVP